MGEREYEQEKLQLLMAHYHEVGDEARLYDRLIWEIPTVVLAVTTGSVAAYLS